MAIELNINKISTTITGQTDIGSGQGLTQPKQVASLLGGESLKVTSGAMSDLEKLVAQLKNENANTREGVAQRRLSILQTVLDSLEDKITEAEKNAVIELEKLNGEKRRAEIDLAALNSSKTSLANSITALDIEIAALERQINDAIEQGADHREKVAELKARRAEEQAKLDGIVAAIKSTSAKIAGIDAKIAEQSKLISGSTLSEVMAALKDAASDVNATPERPESAEEIAKAEKKAAENDLAAIVRESLDKIDAQIARALEEVQVVKA